LRKILCTLLVCLLASCAHSPKPISKIINEPRPNKKPIVIEQKLPPPKPKQMIELLFPVKGASVSSEFGWRGTHYHRGVDLEAPIGSPVRACMSGTIVSAGKVKFLNGYGNAILIKHWGSVYTYYAHLRNIKLKAGTTVNRGDILGYVGNTGKSSGPHLHLELIFGGHNHNPVPYFFIENTRTEQAMLWLKGVKKSVTTGLGLRKLIGD
jgi:murein DD-endopeptidase MepM/ murein hydrolase activator NlpD